MSEQQIYRLIAYVVGFVVAWAGQEFGLSAVSWVIVFIVGAVAVLVKEGAWRLRGS